MIRHALYRIVAIAEKEWLQIRRDPRSLALALAAPTFLVLLFGYALSVDVKDLRFAVMDQDRSPLSRQFMEKFRHTEYFTFQTETGNYAGINALLDGNAIRIAFVIPPDFEKRINAGLVSPVQVLIDGTDSTTANVASSYISMITAEFNAGLASDRLARAGVRMDRMGIALEPRIWYNEAMKSRNYIIPGLIALILAIICALIASLTMSREQERGTLETLLSTPVRPVELVAGKVIPYLLIGLFDITTSLLIGTILFDLPLRGSFIQLILISLLFLAGMSGLGILISTITKVQVLSVQLSMVVTYLPTFILSGFMFPVANMPAAVQGITAVIPAKYLIVVIKGIALKGIGTSLLLSQIIFLAIFAAAILSITVRKVAGLYPYKGGHL